MAWFFLFFFVSGFCSILYELIWLRLSMAGFGVTSAMVAIVLSTFMAGLGLGSWLSGKLIGKYGARITFPALRLYALTELLIGVSAIVVPLELHLGRQLLEHLPLASSASYYLASGIWVAIVLVPACACMGATIPVAMLAIEQKAYRDSRRSFSFLYLANVMGAVTGALVPLLLIEVFGFHGTLKIGAALNAALALMATALTFDRGAAPEAVGRRAGTAEDVSAQAPVRDRWLLVLLFGTGLTSMGVEVVWIREFTPYVGTQVYAFATILAVYLLATFLGSQYYRRWSRRQDEAGNWLWGALGLTVLLPLMAADPHFMMSRTQRLGLGVAPLSAVLGFVTPMLVDRWSRGRAEQAGPAYAVNVLGCILGPLLSGFLLMPYMNERWVLFLFALPWLAAASYLGPLGGSAGSTPHTLRRRAGGYLLAALALVLVFESRSFEDRFQHRVVLRDSTATVIATGEGMNKQLLVNGIGMTVLTPITKLMAHLPLAHLTHPPKNILVICMGMGTTYRSFLSWGLPSTVVELVPSVPRLFGFYNPSYEQLLQSPLSHVVVDDGRRYMERTQDQYDVIALDPPPPVEAAGSSLLYSKEFYATARQHLRPGGILQQWLPFGDAAVRASVARAINESFPYVRVFRSLHGWGYHFLASDQPIPKLTPEELAQRLPEAAAKDLIEWGPDSDAAAQFAEVIRREIPISEVIADAPQAPALRDDRPINEYYAIRRKWLNPHRWYVLW